MVPFVFENILEANLSSIVLSNTVPVASGTTVSITSTNCTIIKNGIDVGSSTTVINGNTIQLKVVSSAENSAPVHAYVHNVTQNEYYSFTVITKPPVLVIDPDYYYNTRHYNEHLVREPIPATVNYVHTYQTVTHGHVEYTSSPSTFTFNSNTIYYPDYYTNNIVAFDTVSRLTATIELSSRPIHLTYNSTHVFAIMKSGYLSIMTIATKALEEVNIGEAANITLDGNTVWVAGTTESTTPFGQYTIRVLADTSCCTVHSGALYAATTSGTVRKYDALGAVVAEQFIGNNIWQLVPFNSNLIAVCFDDSKLVEFNSSLVMQVKHKVPYTPSSVAVSGTSLYVALYESKSVIEINTTTLAQTTLFATHNKPCGLILKSSTLYVQDYDNAYDVLAPYDSDIASYRLDNTVVDYDQDAYSNVLVYDASANVPFTVSIDPFFSCSIVINGVDQHATSAIAKIGDTIQFKLHSVSLSDYDYTHTVHVTLGTQVYSWNVVCRLFGNTPLPFYFDPQNKIEPNAAVTSSTVTIQCPNSLTLHTVLESDGEIILNGMAVGSVTEVMTDDTLAIRTFAPSTFNTTKYVVLRVGNYRVVFGIITKIDPELHWVKDEYACANITDYPVTNTTSNYVTVIDGNTSTTLDTSNVTVTSVFDNVYYAAIADYANGKVQIVDLDNKKVVKSLTGFTGPVNVGSALTTSTVYGYAYVVVADYSASQLVFLEQSTFNKTTNVVNCGYKPYGISNGLFNVLFVTDIENHAVKRYSVTPYALTLAATIPVLNNSKPGNITVDVDTSAGTGKILVPLTCSNKIALIDYATNNLSYITVGNNPTHIGVDATYYWVVNSFDNTLSRIRKTDYHQDVYDAGSYPVYLAVSATKVYIGNFTYNKVLTFDKTSLTITAVTDYANSCYGVANDAEGRLVIASLYAETPTLTTTEAQGASISLHSLNTILPYGAMDHSNTITQTNFRSSYVSIPEYNDAKLLINGSTVQSGRVRSGDTLALQVTGMYRVASYFPIISDQTVATYEIAHPAQDEPLPFYFNSVYGAYVRHLYRSNTIVIEGISDNIIVELTISEGALYKNGVLVNGLTASAKLDDQFCIEYKTDNFYSEAHNITVTTGHYTTDWLIKTLHIERAIPYEIPPFREVDAVGARNYGNGDVTITPFVGYSAPVSTPEYHVKPAYSSLPLTTAEYRNKAMQSIERDIEVRETLVHTLVRDGYVDNTPRSFEGTILTAEYVTFRAYDNTALVPDYTSRAEYISSTLQPVRTEPALLSLNVAELVRDLPTDHYADFATVGFPGIKLHNLTEPDFEAPYPDYVRFEPYAITSDKISYEGIPEENYNWYIEVDIYMEAVQYSPIKRGCSPDDTRFTAMALYGTHYEPYSIVDMEPLHRLVRDDRVITPEYAKKMNYHRFNYIFWWFDDNKDGTHFREVSIDYGRSYTKTSPNYIFWWFSVKRPSFEEAGALYGTADYATGKLAAAQYASVNYATGKSGTAQYESVNYATQKYSFAQYGSVNYATGKLGSAQYGSVNYATQKYSFAQYNSVNYATQKYSFAQYNSANYATQKYGHAQYGAADFVVGKILKTTLTYYDIAKHHELVGANNYKHAQNKSLNGATVTYYGKHAHSSLADHYVTYCRHKHLIGHNTVTLAKHHSALLPLVGFGHRVKRASVLAKNDNFSPKSIALRFNYVQHHDHLMLVSHHYLIHVNKLLNIIPSYSHQHSHQYHYNSLVPVSYNFDWYDCWENCVKSGTFDNATDAYNEALSYGYQPAQIHLAKYYVNKDCWLWYIAFNEITGGYIQGG